MSNQTKLSKKLFLIISFLIPLVLFVLFVIYSFMPTFKLGSLNNNGERVISIDDFLPWIAPFAGVLLFWKVVTSLETKRAKLIYSIFYLIFLMILTFATQYVKTISFGM